MIDVVSMLDGVRDNRGGNYLARCPAHEDRSPSLSVKLCDDGRTLLHCFAGCDVESVVSALGLALADLMPERATEHRVRPMRRSMPAREALVSLDHESLVVAVIAGDIIQHRDIDERTVERLRRAVARIGKVRNECAPARHQP